jgi:SAM-dependent methyltransferase
MPADHPAPWFDRFFQHEYLSFDEHPKTEQEVDFVTDVLDLPQHALLLDLCCGYGRHTIPLSHRGIRTLGLDRSQVMLQRAAESRTGPTPLLLRGDMSRLPFSSGGFDAVVNLFSSFGYFENDDDFRVLQQIAGVLKPGGQFLIETVNREFVVRHFNPVQVYHPQGDILIEERAFDVVSGRSHVDVTLIKDGQTTELHHSVRLYTATELQMLLEAVGLVAEEIWGSFDGDDYTWDQPHMILLARKAG